MRHSLVRLRSFALGLLVLLFVLPSPGGYSAAEHGRAQEAAGAARQPLPADVRAIMERPKYRLSRWGLLVADRATGEVVYDLNGEGVVIPASTTKLFAAAAALDAYGTGYRFETPVYRRGTVDGRGELRGDLVLVASGDLTMGGRNTPEGRIAFTSIDHAEANALPGATLTRPDPLAGLNDLARQVAARGIRRVSGDVLIDVRLFPALRKDDYVLSPIMINDNLVDLTVRPGKAGETASVAVRPQTAAIRVRSMVRTVAAGQRAEITATAPRPGLIEVRGQIPAGSPGILHTFEVEDPAPFARTLFIEALRRQGVAVAASPLGPNRADRVPSRGSYKQANRIAVHRSLPFSENIRLILKVSMNRQADTLIYLLAVRYGKRTFEEGMQQILPFLQKAGLDPRAVSLSDGRGSDAADLFSPRTVMELLRYMSTRPDFRAWYDAQAVIGVDGTETSVVPATSPVRGKAVAKSGTTVAGDLLHDRPILMTRGNAGYMTARSGRELVFALYVMYVPLAQVEDIFAVARDLGTILEVIYERN